jgi:hypothetical protein
MQSNTPWAGRAKRLDSFDIAKIGSAIRVGEDEIRAFMEVEAAGAGFYANGKLKMLFEPHIFWRELGKGPNRDKAAAQGLAYAKWSKKYPSDSYPRLIAAMKIDRNAALRSASWGLGQLMGFNCELAGYASAEDMVVAFADDEENQVKAIVAFLVKKRLDDDLRTHNWRAIESGYNGGGYGGTYAARMAKAFTKWTKIADATYDSKIHGVGSYLPGREKSVGDPVHDALQPTTPTKPNKPVVLKEPANGVYSADVLAVQKRLDEIGYPEVGSFDGKWGSKTRAAVLAFRADAGLPIEPVIDAALLSALMTAGKRDAAPARAMATLADLRADDAKDVKTADTVQITGGIAGVSGLLGVASPWLEQAEGASGVMQRIFDVVNPVKVMVQDNFWIVLAIVGVVIVWQTGILKRIRLEKHRDGRDVSV